MRCRRTWYAAFALLVILLAGCSSSVAGRPSASVLTPTATAMDIPNATATATPDYTPQIQWIPLASQSPADVLAAAKTSDMFKNSTNGGDSPSLAHLGTPQLVMGIITGKLAPIPDYYDIPIHDGSGTIIGAVLCQLNAGHTAMHVGGLVQYGQPRSSGSIAQIGEQQALAEVAAQHHTTPRAGTQPRLIYFAFDQTAEDLGTINWKAGGNSPDDPMWEIVGTDGQQHFAGADGHVYYLSELPFAPAAP